MKKLLLSTSLFLIACESGNDGTTDIPECSTSATPTTGQYDECSSSTTDETNFRTVICRQESSQKLGCTATCWFDAGTAGCTCIYPSSSNPNGTCECCTGDGTCASSKYDPTICKK